MAKAVGVVDILVPGKPTEHRLAELCRQGVAVVPTGPAIGQHLRGHLGEAESIIQFTEGEQPGVRRDPGTMEFQLQAAVETDPQIGRFRFTRRNFHFDQLHPQPPR